MYLVMTRLKVRASWDSDARVYLEHYTLDVDEEGAPRYFWSLADANDRKAKLEGQGHQVRIFQKL